MEPAKRFNNAAFSSAVICSAVISADLLNYHPRFPLLSFAHGNQESMFDDVRQRRGPGMSVAKDSHHYLIEACDGGRSAHSIRYAVENTLGASSFAFVAMTGEDGTRESASRARQNAAHETGLFHMKSAVGEILATLRREVGDRR